MTDIGFRLLRHILDRPVDEEDLITNSLLIFGLSCSPLSFLSSDDKLMDSLHEELDKSIVILVEICFPNLGTVKLMFTSD